MHRPIEHAGACNRRAALSVLLGSAAGAPSARAQAAWPSRPLRFVTPFVAGGGGDTAIRAVAMRAAEILGQPIVIENRPGGKAVVAANAVLQAPADGYSYLVDAANSITNPMLMRDLTFDYATAFAPVMMTARFPQALAVRPDLPVHSVAEFLAYARARPGAVSCGTPPVVGAGHLALELMQMRAGIRLLHVPYRGGADAVRDLLGGQLETAILSTSSLRPPVEAGRARLIAMTSAERTPAYPDVPTLAESGFPDIDIDDWSGLFAVAAATPAILPRLHAAMVQASSDAGVQARMAPLGTVLVASRTDEFVAFLARQRELVGQIIREAGITMQ